MEIHARNFLASLVRLVNINDNYFMNVLENDHESRRNLCSQVQESVLKEFNSSNIHSVIPKIDNTLTHYPNPHGPFQDSESEGNRYQSSLKKMVSPELVKALCH